MGIVAPAANTSLDPVSLKARFKQLQQQTNNVHQNWQIRLHRALSWHRRVVELPEDQPEAGFLFLWIAFNSLYSRWSAQTNAPDVDSHARKDFLRKICQLDADGRIPALLRQNRGLVKKLLANHYLAQVFWREPTNPKAKGWGAEDANYLDRHFKHGEFCTVLEQVVDRLFVFRGQLVHGASSSGSRLNRTTLRYCTEMLRMLVPAMILIAMDQGCGDDWPELCYPPVG